MKRLLWYILILFVLIVPGVAAQEEGEADVPPALVEQLNSIEASVRDLRDLQAFNPVTRVFPTRAEVEAFVSESLDEELTDIIILQETQFYRAFDFVGEDFDLMGVYTRLLSSQIAGFYNPDNQEMHVLLISGDELGDSLPPLEQITYAHEYTHVLQDQHFDLDNYLSESQEDMEPDRALASLSLVEGDAMFITQEYTRVLVQENPRAAIQLLAMSLSGLAEIPEGTPEILEAELTVPYLDGMTFVSAVHDEGGWEFVNAVYDDPPESMEQILHPERYFAEDIPQDVTVQPVDAVLGDGWTLLLERTLGEFYLREYLKTQLSRGEVSRAAAGWGGDRYLLYHDEAADERAWVLRLTWDTTEDASEFADGYRTFAAARFGENVVPTTFDEATCWHGDGAPGALCLLPGENDTLVSYAPEAESAAALIEAQ